MVFDLDAPPPFFFHRIIHCCIIILMFQHLTKLVMFFNIIAFNQQNCNSLNYVHIFIFCASAVQTPGFSPPAPAPAPAKKTPAPGKKLRLRQKTCEN